MRVPLPIACLLVLGSALLLTLVPGDAPAPSFALPPSIRRGVSLVGSWDNVLAHPSTLSMLDEMRGAGVRWVAVVPTWYQADLQATTVYRKRPATPTDDSVRRLIRAARDKGLAVLLKPHVDLETDEWRGLIQPRDRAAWFRSYTQMITRYARMAREEDVAALAIGVELKGLEEDTARWQRVIAAVRSIYPGTLTYAANHDSYQAVAFWDALDWIGIDAYFPVADNRTPTVATMLSRWRTHLDTMHAWRLERGLTSKPVVFAEVGYLSADGTASQPWWYPDTQAGGCAAVLEDLAEQRDAYEALFRAVRGYPWIGGIFIWWWDNPSTADYWPPPGDTWPQGEQWRCHYTPRGKPAFAVLREAYR